MPLVAGIDSSTQATKAVVVDSDDGTVVARGRAPHDVTGSHGARETDPEQWWNALADALAQTGRAGDVTAIAVAAQQHGLVVLDERGRPLRAAKLWNDTQSAPQAANLVADLGGARWWAEHVGVVPVASFTASKWVWLREHEPRHAAAAHVVCLPHDFLNLRLTGTATTDRGDASGTGWFSTHTDAHVSPVLDHIGLDPTQLGPVARDGRAGEVTSEAAATTGLSAGIPVAAGTGDNAGAALGLGVSPGAPIVSLGTSGTAFAVSRRAVADLTGTVASFADATTMHLPLVAALNCTQAVDRMAATLRIDREDVAEDTTAVVLPYYDGERTPNLPEARATVAGLTHATTPQQILLATYRGAAWSLVMALERMDELGAGLDPEAPLTLVGGGARGPVWQRVLGALTGRALQVPQPKEWVAVGAASQAAAITTRGSAYEIARAWRGAAVNVGPVAIDVTARDRLAAVSDALGTLNSSDKFWT